MVVIWLIPHFKKLYYNLLIKSWAPPIKLTSITSVDVQPLDNTLETKVVLHLTTGREKVYVFRNAENQVESFVHMIQPTYTGLQLT
ncbi:MAG TPA: hypothetical protein VD794_00940 [Flavisolibacter sp.]|nr:hypothetical protein [Flavisolibacter sp.]